jgi:hypothetical protein
VCEVKKQTRDGTGHGKRERERVEKKQQIKKEETRGEAGRRRQEEEDENAGGRDTRTRVCSPDDGVAELQSWALSVGRQGPPSVSQHSRESM